MGNTISNLVSKMLFSEQLMQRMTISQTIFNLLKSSAYGVGGVADTVREHFITRIKACVMNPTSTHRKTVCDIAKFYDTHAHFNELPEAA